jgi:hypothetical protein
MSSPHRGRSSSASPLTVQALIEQLAADLRPAPRHAVARRLLAPAGASVIVSVVLVGATLGFRPDMATALATPVFWMKLTYALSLGLLSLWALERLSRPAAPAGRRALWLLAPVAMVAALCAWQLAETPKDETVSVLMGATAAVCPWRILAFSTPPFLGLIWSVRGLAPTHIRATGAVLGLCAGGLGAAAYALACAEATIPFLAAWYSLGILGVACIGFAAAPWALRW